MDTPLRIEVGRAYRVTVSNDLNALRSSAQIWLLSANAQSTLYKTLGAGEEYVLGPYVNTTSFRIETTGIVTIAPAGDEFGTPTKISAIDKVAPYNVLAPEDFGCKGEYEARSQGIWDGTHFSDTFFRFEQKHIGWSFWQDGNLRTIVGVTADGKARVSPDGYGSTGINWRIRGQNDTPYMQAFLNALSPDYDEDNLSNVFAEPVRDLNGPLKFGKVGILTAGKTYPVTNTSAEYSGGKLSCLTVRRRTSVTTIGLGEHTATIVASPGTYGHVLSNKISASDFPDSVELSNFTISGDGGFSSNSLNGLHWETPYGNYSKVDPFPRFYNLRVERAKQHGYYFEGKGEVKIRDCDAFNCSGYGMFLTGQYDVSVMGGQFGGNSKTGFRVDSPGPIQVTGIKSFYNGSAGGSNDEDCAGIVLECLSGDTHVGGGFLYNFQSQESRGAGVVVKIRNCQIYGQVQDPNRSTIGAAGGRPTVKAAVYIKGSYACGNDFHLFVNPALTEYASPNWPADTNIVHIDGDDPFVSANGGPQNNRGDIYYPKDFILPGGGTMYGIQFTGTGTPFSGGGTVNGKNTELKINGVALT